MKLNHRRSMEFIIDNWDMIPDVFRACPLRPSLFVTCESFSGGDLEKRASEEIDLSPRKECASIMEKIYKETPEYWPYGLDVAGHDGGVYMIRDGKTKEACGFVGWQERMDDSKKIGYYSIGILPEWRKKGLAKEAVSQIIKEKSAGVDEVRAFIIPGNAPSHALAKSLNVPVEHE